MIGEKKRKAGNTIYVPPIVKLEVEDIMREDRIPTRADAFKKMVDYTRAGRELKRIRMLDFSRSGKLPPIYSDKEMNKINKMRKRGMFL